MHVIRENGTIVGVLANSFPDTVELPDDDPDLITFLNRHADPAVSEKDATLAALVEKTGLTQIEIDRKKAALGELSLAIVR